ncbi:hypothetical protein PILCRDRAFT_732394 [Piloderma croceum F 1598]|uniref:Uncharacterized protein n=1 Tax=Piloderma croceum (strain F 1598) TaxID=765440 RepID=A0A0C3EYZ6_PILCF|nr:hypothetical protein PILCRDRAFT_732394 [Piloderma croceum F 1598]
MFSCADCESDRKAGQPVPNCTILPSNTSTLRQITEHANLREYNGQVCCRIICSSFLISHLYLHNRSNRAFINGQPSLESGPHELKSDGMFVRISSHCIPYSHLLTGICHQRCMRLLTRSYRHTAATMAATTPARENGALVVHNRHPPPVCNTPRLGRRQAAMEATTTSQLRTCIPTSQARCCPSKAEGGTNHPIPSLSRYTAPRLHLHSARGRCWKN